MHRKSQQICIHCLAGDKFIKLENEITSRYKCCSTVNDTENMLSRGHFACSIL